MSGSVVITGGCGFLGAALADKIARNGVTLPNGRRLSNSTIHLWDIAGAAAPDVPALEALVATLHQANGALLLALATLAAVWTLRMARGTRGSDPGPSTEAGLPA